MSQRHGPVHAGVVIEQQRAPECQRLRHCAAHGPSAVSAHQSEVGTDTLFLICEKALNRQLQHNIQPVSRRGVSSCSVVCGQSDQPQNVPPTPHKARGPSAVDAKQSAVGTHINDIDR